MKKLIYTIGLPGSGKSTWARQIVDDNPGSYKRINKDDLRAMLDNSKHSRSNEQFILEVETYLVNKALDEGKHVIVDNTHFASKHEQRLKGIVHERLKRGDSVQLELKSFLDVPLETCVKRDKIRPNSVGEKVIREMHSKYIEAKQRPRWEDRIPKQPWLKDRPDLENCIICDLDGTLCLLNGRNPYDASSCENDILNVPIKEILHVYYERQYRIILMSGRMDTWRKETEKWLVDNGVHYDELHMRKEGDQRKDAKIKNELYEKHVKDRYNVRFVLDDRNQMVDFWRSIDITCFQVAVGDF